MNSTEKTNLIEEISKSVRAAAHDVRENAGLSGEYHDGGAGEMLNKLDAWLDGITFARTGKTALYNHLVVEISRKTDPEYQKYLELKKKFEK